MAVDYIMLKLALFLVLVPALAAFWLLKSISSVQKSQRDSASAARARDFGPNKICVPTYRRLFFQLHHLERHPEVIPTARSLLLSLLSEALGHEQQHNKHDSILSLQDFSADALDAFVQADLTRVTTQWRDYLSRRQNGDPRQYFNDQQDARRWLLSMAPVKLVDGAWLGHIHKITTAFHDRAVTKAAWQVLSEELGDGDLTKCHAHVYAQLLERVGATVAPPDSIAFASDPRPDDPAAWRSAVAQLLISLFPTENLPEVLGFNLHFEMLTYETLVVSKELREVNIDPYYFTLHVTIDNADSGHTAMASRIVSRYLQSIALREGRSAANQAWKRVQAGFVLSKNVHNLTGPAPIADRVLAIFQAKAAASIHIHERCPSKIGGRRLSEWLQPDKLSEFSWQIQFLDCLSRSNQWIRRGDSSRSRFIELFSWGGSMFGAFTDREVALVRQWIDSLNPDDLPGSAELQPTNDLKSSRCYLLGLEDSSNSFTLVETPWTMDLSKIQTRQLIPLWFTHPCLLESIISVPWNAASPFGCAVVRFLRAQHGFLPEPNGVSGLDEAERECVDVVSIGLELFTGLGIEEYQDVAQILNKYPSGFAESILTWAMRPLEHRWVLLGLAQAFVQLHHALSSSTLLSRQTCYHLARLADREQDSLRVCVKELSDKRLEWTQFCNGYALARKEIQDCFQAS